MEPGPANARFDAGWRHYRYHLWEGEAASPLARTTWPVGRVLDVAAMELASYPLIGEHDFASFCRRPKVAEDEAPPSLVRRVLLTQFSGPTRSSPNCSASRSTPRRSATRWSARSSEPWSMSGSTSARRAT
ncbi:MAG: hypothetical protein R2715_25025 [Ilumatobacteraceae bacterium]